MATEWRPSVPGIATRSTRSERFPSHQQAMVRKVASDALSPLQMTTAFTLASSIRAIVARQGAKASVTSRYQSS
jgi:hypothetical protein